MAHLRAIVAAAAVLAACATAVCAAERPLVRIGTEGAYPPFNNKTAQGELTGFDIDIARALCDRMEVDCVFVVQDWEGMIPGLLANRYDAIVASMAITEERRRKVDFTDRYYATRPALVVPLDSPIEKATDAGLAGRSVGAQTATTHANYAEAKFPSAEVKLYPIPLSYQEELRNGRLDAAIDDLILLRSWIDEGGGSCCKVLAPLPVDPVINGEGIGIAVRKTSTDLREQFNAAIAAIRADGTYMAINDAYFPFDIYGE